MGKCPNTKRSGCKPIFAVYDARNNRIAERYPIASFEPGSMDRSIPEAIRADYAEARRCQYVNAFKGAVALYRRVSRLPPVTTLVPRHGTRRAGQSNCSSSSTLCILGV